jgi:hypothetical protein
MELHTFLGKLVGKRSNKEVAKDLGIAEPTVSQWLSGGQPCPEPYLAQMVYRYSLGDEVAKREQILHLLLLRFQETLPSGADKKWGTETLTLTRNAIAGRLEESFQRLAAISQQHTRDLSKFPNAFYPLVIVSGDKREDSESRISQGDFGAVTASPAEARYLLSLGLRPDVEFFSDKIFVLEGPKELRARFGKKNILVLGSPGSNHLCRRLHLATPTEVRRGVPIFRFNVGPWTLDGIEEFLLGLRGLNSKELVGKQGDPRTNRSLRHSLRQLFTGGIVDPTNQNLWLRAVEIPPARDFGVVTLARNPFADDDKYACIIAAGFHMFGTAYALKMLGTPSLFSSHPFGGVLRVDMDSGKPFGQRFDSCRVSWDDEQQAGYSKEILKYGLSDLLKKTPPGIHVTPDELSETIAFIEALG